MIETITGGSRWNSDPINPPLAIRMIARRGQIITCPICVCSYRVTEACRRQPHLQFVGISPVTSPNFRAMVAPDRKFVRPEAWPWCNRRRTFPDAHPDCRCSEAPLPPVFSDQQANPIVYRRDAHL